MRELDRNPAGAAPTPMAVESARRRRPLPFHPGPVGRLRNYFLTGLIMVGPLYSPST